MVSCGNFLAVLEFSSCGTVFSSGGVWAWPLGSMQDLSSPTRDRTLAVEARSLNHWTSRDVPGAVLDEWWGQKQGCSEWSRRER